MAKIQVSRQHALGLPGARKIAFKWAEQAEEHFSMQCSYEEGRTQDEVTFKRSGVDGTLKVTRDSFELNANLGFLLGAFKEKIEGEIVKNLDALLAKKPAAKAVAAKTETAKAVTAKAIPKKSASR